MVAGFCAVDGTTMMLAQRAFPTALLPLHVDRKVPRRACALLRMTSLLLCFLTSYFAFRISLSKSGFESSRTR